MEATSALERGENDMKEKTQKVPKKSYLEPTECSYRDHIEKKSAEEDNR